MVIEKENIKKCCKCLETKILTEFYLKNSSKDGYSNICIVCKKELDKEYYIKNKEKICKNVKNYLKLNHSKVKESKLRRKDKISLTKSEYNKNNKEKIAQYNSRYNSENKAILAKKHKEYKELNKVEIAEYKRKYRKENKSIYDKWRALLHSSLKRLGKPKEGKTIDILGYSALDLKNHMIALFNDGMSWNNHGEWHIDHIKPVSKFDKETPMNIVNALSNLQPLWATTREINGVIYEGNLNKSNK